MASIKYLIQSKKSPANIYAQLSLGRGKVWKRKTGYTIDPKDWSKTGKAINRDEHLKNLNASLSRMSSDLIEALNESTRQKKEIDANWLENRLSIINGTTIAHSDEYIVTQIQYIIDNANKVKKSSGKVGLSDNRIKSYKTFKKTIVRFQNEMYKGKMLSIKDVNVKLSDNFFDWLQSQNYSKNYIGKNIDNLKSVCNKAGARGIEVSNELQFISGFQETRKSEDVIILSEEEQELIAATSLDSKALQNARKWLLLGCQVGQRFSDFIRIKPEYVKKHGNYKMVVLTQEKTDKYVTFPLLPKALKILESGYPYEISLQKFNKYSKLICEIAGLNQPTSGAIYPETKEDGSSHVKIPGVYPKWQLISSHICRRSFASNYYGKIPTSVLIGITRHSTEQDFLRYIRRNNMDNAIKMAEWVDKLNVDSIK